MAIASMKIVNIVGPLSRFEDVIELVGRSGVFQPEDALSFYSNTKSFTPMSQDNPYKPILAMLDASIPKNATLQDIIWEGIGLTYEEMKTQTESFVEKMTELNSIKEDLKLQHAKKIDMSQSMEHFVGLDLDMKEISVCKYTAIRFGKMPTACFEKLGQYEKNKNLFAYQCTTDDTYTYGVFFAPKATSAEIDRILSGLYFERTYVPETDMTIERRFEILQTEIKKLENEIKEAEENIDKFWEESKMEISKLHSQIEEACNLGEIKKYAAQYFDIFTLVGWIPAWDGRKLLKELKKMDGIDCEVDNAELEAAHNPPVLLKNTRVMRPFEFFVDMYGMPSYGGFDPTPFVAITYMLLFGIMFGDVGQGILVSIIGWLMWKLKGMKLGKILIPCGISSTLFGLVYGSVFGFEHALDPLYKALFGWNEKPIEVMKPATTNMIIYMSVGIGLVLVICAMLLNIYSCIKRKDMANLFLGSNGLPGLAFYASLVAGLICQLLLNIKIMSPLYIIFLIVLPLVIMFLREPIEMLFSRKKEKIAWGSYLAQSFFELFETILSYVTNTMSFLRVGAFVLVHAGMMLVVFTLAEMTSGIGYVLILIVGNIIVMCLEALLVGIQVLRLEFYEMFSRFFDGGGRPFSPVSIKEKVK